MDENTKDIVDKSRLFVLNLPPAGIIFLGFGLFIVLGTILLSLPAASSTRTGAGFLTALFTATSAVCVTGLVVVDTATAWSSFGQIVILFLIQIGALGIMSIATLFSLITGRKMGLKERMVIQESLNEFKLSGVVRLLKNILLATFIIEAAGALLLSTRFIPLYGIGNGIAKSIFHSVSAFCNAGFDIFGTPNNSFTSLSLFTGNPMVIITIALLFITGGIGFIAWRDIVGNRRFSEYMLHTKLVILITFVLIISGTIFIFLFEYNNPAPIPTMPFISKAANSFFHAITPRTAGFNTLPVDKMTAPSRFLMILFMFIGAAPGSTGGGVKETTAGIIFLAVIAYIRGKDDVNVMERKIPYHIIKKSLSIIALSMMLVFAATFILLINNEGSFMEVLFESTSAFGTVGLSMGITPTLGVVSRIAIIITMFLGRIGPVTAAIVFALRYNGKKILYSYPEGKITVG